MGKLNLVKKRIDWSKDNYCSLCNRLMRKYNAPDDGVSIKHSAGTVCSTCYNTCKANGVPIPDDRVSVFDDNGDKLCLGCKDYTPLSGFEILTSGVYNVRCRICVRSSFYGIDKGIFLATMDSQEHRCGGCRVEFNVSDLSSIQFDHCHATGRFRGLLCSRCNSALGNLSDSLEKLLRASTYLSSGTLTIPLDYRYPGYIKEDKKFCEGCGRLLPLEDFRPFARGGIGRKCNQCNHLISRFNISWNQFRDILRSQDDRCAICLVHSKQFKYRLNVDHDHSCCDMDSRYATCGGCIRGILCSPCNIGLGFTGDSFETISNLVEYIQQDIPRYTMAP